MNKIHFQISLAHKTLPIKEFVDLLHDVFPGSSWTNAFFHWKHLENPLGPSILVWAIFQGRVIGFRALWRMELRSGGRKIKAYQPCDTVVSPSFRGRGIFSEMTRMGRNAATQQGGKLLFNFPTKMSLGGYLKLGWRPQPSICRYLHPVNPSQVFWVSIGNRWWRQSFMPASPSSPLELEDFRCKYWHKPKVDMPSLSLTQDYLTWRFLTNPKDAYGVARKDNERLVYRIGSRGGVKIVELVAWSGRHLNALTRGILSEMVKAEHPSVISLVSPCQGPIFFTGRSFFRVPSNLNFVATDLKSREKLPTIMFEPALYDTA